MRSISTAITLLAGFCLASPFSLSANRYAPQSVSRRNADAEPDVFDAPTNEHFDTALLSYLEKRRGGGGRSGGGSSGGSSGSKGGGGSRNTGTASSSSSVRPSYGGGRYYGGGATSAYRAGGRSPRGIAPFVLLGAGLAIFPGLWLYGAYAYPYTHDYNYHNATNTTQSPSGSNESLPVTCLCQKYSACGCDDNNNSTYLDSVVGNSSLAHISNVNGTKTLVLNGTLPNGTDTSNGTNSTSSSSSSAATTKQTLLELSGFWLVGAVVAATIWTI